MLPRRIPCINIRKQNLTRENFANCKAFVRGLHNNTPAANTSAFPAAKSVQYDEESLWVRSSKPNVDRVVGYTVPEIIRENLGGWGHLPAYVRLEDKYKYFFTVPNICMLYV